MDYICTIKLKLSCTSSIFDTSFSVEYISLATRSIHPPHTFPVLPMHINISICLRISLCELQHIHVLFTLDTNKIFILSVYNRSHVAFSTVLVSNILMPVSPNACAIRWSTSNKLILKLIGVYCDVGQGTTSLYQYCNKCIVELKCIQCLIDEIGP